MTDGALQHLDRALETLYCGSDDGDPEGIVLANVRAAIWALGSTPRSADDCPDGPVGVDGSSSDFSVRIIPALEVSESRIVVEGQQSLGQVSDLDIYKIRDLLAPIIKREKGWSIADISFTYYAYADVTGRGKVTSFDVEPEAVTHQVWNNGDSAVESDFHADLSDEVTISTSTSWEQSTSHGASFTASVEVGFGGDKAGLSTSYSFEVTEGHSESKDKSVAVGSSSGVSTKVPAGQVELAVLLLQRGKLKGKVTYTRNLHGWVNVSRPGTAGLRVPIDQLGLPADVRVQDIETDFFADVDITTTTIDGVTDADIQAGIDDVLKRAKAAQEKAA